MISISFKLLYLQRFTELEQKPGQKRSREGITRVRA